MTNVPFTKDLTESDFSTHDQPEVALAKLRWEIQSRLKWLEDNLLTGHKTDSGKRLGQALADKLIVDKKTLEAITEILDAANPAIHGRTVQPSTAGTVVVHGIGVLGMLDVLVNATQYKLKTLSSESKLVYRYLELPTLNRWGIAKRFDLADRQEVSTSKIEHARKVFKLARERKQLSLLWNLVADEGGILVKSENPFTGK